MAGTDAGVSVPIFQPDEKRHRRDIAQWAQWATQGHLQNAGSVTLRASQTTTTVTDERVSVNSVPLFTPMTSSAAATVPTLWVSTVTTGSFTITHSSTAAVDKTFRYALLG
jgi:hypothetical protein